ncbi:MAG: radical SAM protein [bacterium]
MLNCHFGFTGTKVVEMFLEIQTRRDGTKKSDKILINVKKQAISVSINTFTVFTFDLRGRLITAVSNGHTFRRSLDNRIMEKWSMTKNSHHLRTRLWLKSENRHVLIDQIHERIRNIYSLLKNDRFEILTMSMDDLHTVKPEVLNALEKILYFDFNRLEKDARTFSAIYPHVGILPPDMYLAILLQATQGCSYNQCNYCYFYKDQPYRIKSEREFSQHIQAVKKYFGEAMLLRKYLFLGEANALDIYQSVLLNFLDAINQQFYFSDTQVKSATKSTVPVLAGIYSFLTAFHKNQKSADDFAELKAKNLRKVYIGMETGSDELLHFLNKPGKTANVVGIVNDIKQAGVHVGIIILLGAGGRKYYQSHTNETILAVNEMNLGNGDTIFFSPIKQLLHTHYEFKLAKEKIAALSPEEMENQRRAMTEGFNFPNGVQSPKIAIYDINEFIY